MKEQIKIQSLEKNKIIFLKQDGYSNSYIAEKLNLSLYEIESVLHKIQESKNQIFICRSLTNNYTYYVFDYVRERKMIVDDLLRIANFFDFDKIELELIYELYGFRT